MEDLSLVTGDDGLDVVLDNGSQGSLVVDVLNPLWELGVPEEGVATDLLAVGLSPVDEVISVGEVELSTVWLKSIPLHGVLWGDLSKVALDDCSAASGEEVLVSGNTKVLLALGLELCVNAG